MPKVFPPVKHSRGAQSPSAARLARRRYYLNNKPVDRLVHRVKPDHHADGKSANEIVDEIYSQTRDGVNWEIDQVDELFLRKNPGEINAEEVELTNLVDEKVKKEEQKASLLEIKNMIK